MITFQNVNLFSIAGVPSSQEGEPQGVFTTVMAVQAPVDAVEVLDSYRLVTRPHLPHPFKPTPEHGVHIFDQVTRHPTPPSVLSPPLSAQLVHLFGHPPPLRHPLNFRNAASRSRQGMEARASGELAIFFSSVQV
eukprot:Sspe_Gene.98447::Locus_71863_Transcript_1_1_Confidence_1.000_Length_607::g.98447::m.98447